MYPQPVIVDPKSWVVPPMGATGDEPATGTLVAATLGWLLVGGVVGAALWALGHEIASTSRGQR